MKVKEVDITPDTSLLDKLRANLTPSESIGELVANCFDARNNEDKLNISIDLRGDTRIIDKEVYIGTH